MNANASEAIYVLDGLLYHGSDLPIETHYVYTGGVSDMSFALCHLVGFQIVPRLRGFKDRKLYLFRATHLPKTLHRSLATPSTSSGTRQTGTTSCGWSRRSVPGWFGFRPCWQSCPHSHAITDCR
jgi:TnpA family transposase